MTGAGRGASGAGSGGSGAGWSWSGAALLTDLDGVLVDSTEVVESAWRWWAARVGVDPDTVLAHAHGVRTIETVRRFAPDGDIGAEVAAVEGYEERHRSLLRPVPGAARLVGAVSVDRWAVVTSGSARTATDRLEVAELPRPAVLVTADDVVHGKPDPEGYLAAAAALRVPVSACLVVEDAPAGIAAARAAGAAVVAVATSHDPDLLVDADMIVSGPASLDAMMAADGRVVVTAHP